MGRGNGQEDSGRIEDHLPDALLEGRRLSPEGPFDGRTGLRQRADGEDGRHAPGLEQLLQDSRRRRNHRVTACWTTEQDVTLINSMPHMHLRGKAMEIKVVFPDGKSETVLNVPR